MSELVSVIIPVYNVKPYLIRCLSSIVGQSCRNLEILVIDDGSTDGSSEICDRFAAEDDRIRVFPQILNRCRTIHVLPEVLYHHQMNPESITHKRTYENFLDSFKSRRAVVRFIIEKYPELRGKADQYMLKTCLTHWYKLFLTDLDDKTRRHLQKKLRARAGHLYRLCGPAEMPFFQKVAADLMLYCPLAAKCVYKGLCFWNRCRGF